MKRVGECFEESVVGGLNLRRVVCEQNFCYNVCAPPSADSVNGCENCSKMSRVMSFYDVALGHILSQCDSQFHPINILDSRRNSTRLGSAPFTGPPLFMGGVYDAQNEMKYRMPNRMLPIIVCASRSHL